MAELTANVNWLAVIVGAIVAYGLGWLWYGPVFGKSWSTGLGISMPEKMPVGAMVAQAIGTFLLAWLFGITAAVGALATVMLAVATIVAFTISGGLFAQKPINVIVIDAGYIVLIAVVLFLAQAAF